MSLLDYFFGCIIFIVGFGVAGFLIYTILGPENRFKKRKDDDHK